MNLLPGEIQNDEDLHDAATDVLDQLYDAYHNHLGELLKEPNLNEFEIKSLWDRAYEILCF